MGLYILDSAELRGARWPPTAPPYPGSLSRALPLALSRSLSVFPRPERSVVMSRYSSRRLSRAKRSPLLWVLWFVKPTWSSGKRGS